MAVYELTVRFEAGADSEALEFAVEVEKTVKAEAVMTPMEWVHQKCVIGQLTRILAEQMEPGDESC
jgi:hypothetical protein